MVFLRFCPSIGHGVEKRTRAQARGISLSAIGMTLFVLDASRFIRAKTGTRSGLAPTRASMPTMGRAPGPSEKGAFDLTVLFRLPVGCRH